MAVAVGAASVPFEYCLIDPIWEGFKFSVLIQFSTLNIFITAHERHPFAFHP